MKKKKQNKDCLLFVVYFFVVGILLGIVGTNIYLNLSKDCPDCICNENKDTQGYKQVEYKQIETYTKVLGASDNCFPLDYEIICEEGLEIVKYKYSKEQCVWYTDVDNYYPDLDCLIDKGGKNE